MHRKLNHNALSISATATLLLLLLCVCSAVALDTTLVFSKLPWDENLVGIVYPDSEVVSYNYDLAGNLNRVHTYKANHRDTLIKYILYDENK